MAVEKTTAVSTVMWRIKNVSFLNEIHDWKISSPEFQLRNYGTNKWTISLFRGDQDKDDEERYEDNEERYVYDEEGYEDDEERYGDNEERYVHDEEGYEDYEEWYEDNEKRYVHDEEGYEDYEEWYEDNEKGYQDFEEWYDNEETYMHDEEGYEDDEEIDESEDEDDEEIDESEDEEGDGDGTHTIFNFRPSFYKRKVSMECEWSLLDGDGSIILTRKKKYETKHAKCKHEMPDCPFYDDVFETRKSLFLPHDTLTMRLCVWDSEKDFTQADHITAVTRLKVQRESIKWRIERFKILQLHKKVITSISVGGDVFSLVFSLTGTSLSDASVNFEILTESSCEQSLTVEFSVLGQEEREIKCMKETHVFKSSILEQTWVVPIFLSRQEILQHLFDDDLILLFSFNSVLHELHQCIEKSYYGPTNLTLDDTRNVSTAVENRAIPRIAISSVSESSSNSLAILQEDLLSLFTEHAMSDFELRRGDTSIPVHKVILSARSPVFRAMFSSNMKESDSKSLEIPDVDVHTLGRMLNFLYTGTIEHELQWENAAKLYYAADKYEVPSLKQECSTVLESHITVSNVADILELADRHQDEKLTLCAVDFIEKHFDDVIRSDEWGNFLERSCLAGKTLKDIYIKRASK